MSPPGRPGRICPGHPGADPGPDAPRLERVPDPDPTPAVEITGLTMRYGDKTAVDDLTMRVESGTITAVLGPNGAGKTTSLETCEGYRVPAAGPGARARSGPGPRPARPAPPDRGDAAGRRGVVRRARDGDAPARGPAARAPVGHLDARRSAGAGRLRAHAVPPALRGPAAAARAGDGRGRAPRAGVRRRAHGRHGRRCPAHDLGAAGGAAPRRGDRRADHPLPGGGRAAGRPGAHHRPRRADRLRLAARADPGRLARHDPAGRHRAVPARGARVAAPHAGRRGRGDRASTPARC